MKSILQRVNPYYVVRLGRLDVFNPAMKYQFPTRKAALRFGRRAARRRHVVVIDRYGRTVWDSKHG